MSLENPETSPSSAGSPGEAPASIETEIKLPVADLIATRARIREAGFTETDPRSFERNFVFDDPDGSLLATKRLLRLREYRGEAILTFKGAPIAGKHKQREEIECTVGSADRFLEILTRLGYRVTFRYEKFRTVLKRNREAGLVTVDETPAGAYLELEGAPDWIDRTAAELGYDAKDYITSSYGTIAREFFTAKGLPPGDFVFPHGE